MLGCAVMDWFVKGADGREAGPMNDDDVRSAYAAGRATLVRRGTSQTWVAIADTPFGRTTRLPSARPPGRRVSDLSPEEARELIRSAVASGVTQAGLLLALLAGLLLAGFVTLTR